MTEQQYNRAVWINKRIKQLESVKKEIGGPYKYRLSFSWKGDYDWKLCNNLVMSQISEILDKHDLMIRQEIDEEIERLKAEIKRL